MAQMGLKSPNIILTVWESPCKMAGDGAFKALFCCFLGGAGEMAGKENVILSVCIWVIPGNVKLLKLSVSAICVNAGSAARTAPKQKIATI